MQNDEGRHPIPCHCGTCSTLFTSGCHVFKGICTKGNQHTGKYSEKMRKHNIGEKVEATRDAWPGQEKLLRVQGQIMTAIFNLQQKELILCGLEDQIREASEKQIWAQQKKLSNTKTEVEHPSWEETEVF